MDTTMTTSSLYSKVDITKRYCIVDISSCDGKGMYTVSFSKTKPCKKWSDEYKTSKIVLRRIDPGGFKTVSGYEVQVSKPFFIGIFPVTTTQYKLIMGQYDYSTGDVLKDTTPAVFVSYDDIRGAKLGAYWPLNASVDADSFMGRMRERTKLLFDLPTEAQWEFACRSGSGMKYWYGDHPDPYFIYTMREERGHWGPSPVGRKPPNRWGLYDMHGNVWETCLDWSGDDDLQGLDPVGPTSGQYRIACGGSWDNNEYGSTAAARCIVLPSDCGEHAIFGFRIALLCD